MLVHRYLADMVLLDDAGTLVRIIGTCVATHALHAMGLYWHLRITVRRCDYFVGHVDVG